MSVASIRSAEAKDSLLKEEREKKLKTVLQSMQTKKNGYGEVSDRCDDSDDDDDDDGDYED